jgi:hypothetical protein
MTPYLLTLKQNHGLSASWQNYAARAMRPADCVSGKRVCLPGGDNPRPWCDLAQKPEDTTEVPISFKVAPE